MALRIVGAFLEGVEYLPVGQALPGQLLAEERTLRVARYPDYQWGLNQSAPELSSIPVVDRVVGHLGRI